MRATGLFVATTSIAVAAATCPAAGSTDSQGRYSCNPAHAYPNGQSCKEVDGCPFLVGADGKPVNNSPSTSSTAAKPSKTCADPGAYDAKGRYSCNPAHQYPNGQGCKDIDGCPLLVGSDGKPIIETVYTSSAASATATPSCAAPGTNDGKGRYSCNPAHQYPGGQKCVTVDGCPLLVGADGKPVTNTVLSSAKPTATAACAAPGAYDDKGRYSCNLAHQYPNGQKCVVIDGCPLICGNDGKPITNTVTASAKPTASAAACAAPGQYDAKGRYSCNPAHQYPNGQACTIIEGCPLLCGGDGKPIATHAGAVETTAVTVKPSQTGVVTAGASSVQVGLLAAIGAFVALL